MSFEKPPKTPEQEVKKTPTQEERKEQEKTVERAKASENIASVLSPENKSFFGKMSERGKEIANEVYEGLYKTSAVNRIVGKLEIAYNQFWIDRHQEKAAKFKEKMDALDLRISTLDQSKKDIESVIKNLKQQNLPGVESLQIKLQDIDKQKENLLNKKDRIQSKFEARENKMKLYTNERDRVADKLIRSYEEKLKPMEAELERLQTFRNQIDLEIAVTEAKHKELLAKLNDIEKKKNQIEEALRMTGMSERKIKKFEAIKQLERVLEDGRKEIRIEKENLARRKAEIDKRIDKRIAKVEAKANPYRDKREKFIRIKERRPIKFEVPIRQRGEVFRGEEKIMAHRRVERGYTERPTTGRFEAEREVEEKAEDKERLRISDFLAGWNNFLKERYKEAGKLVDIEDFLRTTRLSKDFKLDFEDFKNILGKYLKFRKLPMEQFNKSIDVFFEKIREKSKG